MVFHNRHFKVGLPSGVEFEQNVISVSSELFKYLVRGMQFTYEVFRFNNQVDKILPNGTWTGATGYLNRSEIDFLETPFLVSYDVNEAVYMTFPFDVDETVFSTRKPEYSPKTGALFQTLSLNVWLSLLATTILFALLCFAGLKHRYNLEEIFFHVLAIGLNQEGDVVPRRGGGSLLLGRWMVGMALFTFCFKSVLLSFLTFPNLQGVKTVPELAAAIRTGKYSAHGFSADIANFNLANSLNADIRTIGESILKTPTSNSSDLITKSVMDAFGLLPNKALVILREIMSFMEEMTYISEETLETSFRTIATEKDFCCKEEMNMLIHRFAAAGISKKINRVLKHLLTLYSYSKEKPDYEENTWKVTLTDLSGAFILLVAGHCLSVCVLIVELRMKKREKRHSITRKK